MSSVYFLTLRQLASRGRMVVMLLLASLPIWVVGSMLTAHSSTVQDFESVVLSTMLCGTIGPLVALATAAASFGNELEDKTLANLTLSPVSRWRIALPKLLATLTIAAPVMAASSIITCYIAFLGEPKAIAAVTGAVLAGVVMYAAAFVWLGLKWAQAVGIGLLYIVVWEGFFSGLIAGVRYFSIRAYAIALMHGFDARRFVSVDHVAFRTASIFAVVLVVGFLLLTTRRLRSMDVP